MNNYVLNCPCASYYTLLWFFKAAIFWRLRLYASFFSLCFLSLFFLSSMPFSTIQMIQYIIDLGFMYNFKAFSKLLKLNTLCKKCILLKCKSTDSNFEKWIIMINLLVYYFKNAQDMMRIIQKVFKMIDIKWNNS